MSKNETNTLKLFERYQSENNPIEKNSYLKQLLERANAKPKLKSLTIKDYRNFSNGTLKFPDSDFIVICGVNGAGKTSLIRAIAASLSWLFNRIHLNGGRGWNGRQEDISLFNNSKFCTTSLTIDVLKRLTNIEINKAFDEFEKVSSNVSEATDIGNIYKYLKSNNKSVNTPLFEYYSLDRNNLFKEPSQSEYAKAKEATPSFGAPINLPSTMVWYKKAYDRYKDTELTSTKASLKELFEMLVAAESSDDIALITNEINKLKSSDKQFSKDFSEQVVNDINYIVHGFISGVTEVLFTYENETRLTFIKNDKKIFFDQLSHGEQAVFALLVDIYRKLSSRNIGDPKKGSGIILIDELDLHLHPEWQRKIVKFLPNIFKNCQFIVATHSAQIIGEVKPDSVIVLKNDPSGITSWHRADRTLGVSSNEILNEIMSSSDQLSINTESLEKYIEVEKYINNGDFSTAKVKIKELEDIFGETPDLIRLKFELELSDMDFDQS